MAPFALTDATIWLNQYDLTGYSNGISGDDAVQDLPTTTFASQAVKERIGGLGSFDGTIDAYLDYADDASHEAVYTTKGVGGTVTTLTPFGDDGTVAFLCTSLVKNYRPTGKVGEVAALSFDLGSDNKYGLIGGTLLLPKQSLTGNTSGTGAQLGTVSASRRLYTTIHCFTAGTTATVIVESDDNSGFTSATTRSSTVVTAVGGTFVTPVSGAITDDWWRVRVGTVTGTFVLAAAVGIAA